MLKLGGNVDSWCGKCNMILAHTIEALVGDKPMRVHCNTCKAAHAYKPNKPSDTPKTAKAGDTVRSPRRSRATSYEGLLTDKNVALAKRYSPKDTYSLGDVVEHPTFGVGIATALKDATKVEVLFKEGLKLLAQGR